MFDVLRMAVMRSRMAAGLPPRKRRERPAQPRPKRQPKPLLRFVWEFRDGLGRGGIVKAKSRVDARSEIKRQLRIPMKRRLPLEVFLERVRV
jgi:hypothetical protein